MLDQFFSQISFIDVFNFCMFLICTIFYSYQFIYVLRVLASKPKELTAKRNHRYAVLISARNEEAVIGNLIHSIKVQNYPQELIDVFVVADNCTDDTAKIAEEAGAIVFRRNNTELIGKGYALDYCLKTIKASYSDRGYEAYFVFDADNVLDVNYFREMNKTFDNGALAATSYRNSKNYDSNWISAGYATWFLREARFLSEARLAMNTSCAISGTGFYIAAEILDKAGWQWYLLTEDIEFSTAGVIDGLRISYCPKAILYDEQPITFRDSWNQRMRWAKGFYQVFGKYAGGLFRGIFTQKRGHRFACYDMFMTIFPGMLLTFFSLLLNGSVVVLGLTGVLTVGTMLAASLSSMVFCVLGYALLMFMLGALTTFVEWDSIHAPASAKIRYMFTFPFFMLTYMPIALVALVKKPEWKPIKHSIAVNAEDIAGSAAREKEAVVTGR